MSYSSFIAQCPSPLAIYNGAIKTHILSVVDSSQSRKNLFERYCSPGKRNTRSGVQQVQCRHRAAESTELQRFNFAAIAFKRYLLILIGISLFITATFLFFVAFTFHLRLRTYRLLFLLSIKYCNAP